MEKHLIAVILFVVLSFFSIIYQPLGSYDMIGPQWFSLSLVNLLFSFLYLTNDFKVFIHHFLRIPFVRLYALFLLLCIFSIFFANDYSYFFHDLGRVFTSFFILINFTYCAFKLGHYKFLTLIAILSLGMSFYELYLSFNPYIIFFYQNGFDDWRLIQFDPMILRGIAGNKNITAALFVMKLPFLLFLFTKKNIFLKSLSQIAVFLTFLVLFFLQTRSTYISLFCVLFFYFIFLYIHYKSYFTQKFLLVLFSFLLSFFIASEISSILSTEDNTLVSSIKSIEISNESSSNRFSLWSHTLDYMLQNPFGAGLGNWKLESIPYWKNIGGSYQVPYHAHNDFLEISVETGFYNGFIYILLFLIPLYISFKSWFLNSNSYFFFLFCGIMIYFIDSFFNFPIERAYMQLLICLYFSMFIVKHYSSNLKL